MKKQRYRSLVAVYAMVLNEQNEILLLRRTNTGYRDGYYDMPAGHLEDGETLRQATLRELREETGLHAHEEDLEFRGLLHRFSRDRVYLDVFFLSEHGQAKRSSRNRKNAMSSIGFRCTLSRRTSSPTNAR